MTNESQILFYALKSWREKLMFSLGYCCYEHSNSAFDEISERLKVRHSVVIKFYQYDIGLRST